MKETRRCVICRGEFSAKTTSPRLTDSTSCSRAWHIQKTKKYSSTPKFRERRRERRRTVASAAEAHKAAQRRYLESTKGIATREKYQHSAKFRVAQKKYYYSAKGRATYLRALAKK